MVQKIFKISASIDSPTGYVLEETNSGTVLALPSCILEELKGKYLTAEQMIEKIDTICIALSGVTDSLRIVEPYSFERRSVLKSFGLRKDGTIDDEIDDFLPSVKEYEKFHTIEMGRDVQGDDSTIHAYLQTPKNGTLRCQFDRGVRVFAKRNNIKYWIDDYTIDSGSQGGEFVRPIGDPVEIR